MRYTPEISYLLGSMIIFVSGLLMTQLLKVLRARRIQARRPLFEASAKAR